MTDVSFSGVQAIEMLYSNTTSGAWSALFHVQLTETTVNWKVGTTGAVVIDSMSMQGTLVSIDSTSIYGRAICIAVGGAGGMSKPGLTRHYASKNKDTHEIHATRIINDILSAAGEKLSTQTSSTLTNKQFNSFDLSSDDSCGQQLTDLCLNLNADATWCCDETGAIKIYVPDRKQTVLPSDVIVQKQHQPGATTYFVPFMDVTTLPGTKNLDHDVNEVLVTATSSQLRLTLLESSMQELNNTNELFFGTYEGTVVKDNANDTFDVVLDDSRLRGKGLAKVQAVYGLPGMHCEVNSGARCTVAFMGGNPSKPRILEWASQTNVKKVVFGDPSAARPIARSNDPVIVYIPGPIPFTGQAVGTMQTTLGPAPFIATIAPGTILFAPQTQLAGVIVAGSDQTLTE